MIGALSLNTSHAPAPAYAVALPDRPIVLLFGLPWAPLVGSHPGRLARRRAIAARATHFTHLGRLGVCFGMVRLTAGRRRSSHHYHAAAALFAASQEAGPVVWLTQLPDGRYWLIAARDAAVLSRSDRLFPDLIQGQEALRGLCSSFPGLEQIDDARALAALATPGASLIDALATRAQRSDAMISLGWYRRAKPLWWACSLAFAVSAAWYVFPVSPPAPAPVASAVQAIAPHEARARWRNALVQTMATGWQGAESFVEVLTRLRALPVSHAGWQLSWVQCDWVRQAWNCRADFERNDSRATNAEFLRILPSNWSAGFVPLDRAFALWTVPTVGRQESPEDLPDVASIDTTLISALQQRAPAFTHITIGAPDVLTVLDVPRSEAGEPIVRPAGLPTPRRRSILVQGPLRSFGLIRELNQHVTWHTLRLNFTPQADVSLNRSALHVELGGWVHEKVSA